MSGTSSSTALRPPSLRPWVLLCGALVGLHLVVAATLPARANPLRLRNRAHPDHEVRLRTLLESDTFASYDRRTSLRVMVDVHARMGRSAVPILMEYTTYELPAVRRFAVGALGMFADSRATATVGAAVDDEDRGVARAAAIALGDLHDPAARKHLLRALERPLPYVRTAAAESLRFHDLAERHVQALMARADDENERVRDAVRMTLLRVLDLPPTTPVRTAAEWAAWWNADGRAAARLARD